MYKHTESDFDQQQQDELSCWPIDIADDAQIDASDLPYEQTTQPVSEVPNSYGSKFSISTTGRYLT